MSSPEELSPRRRQRSSPSARECDEKRRRRLSPEGHTSGRSDRHESTRERVDDFLAVDQQSVAPLSSLATESGGSASAARERDEPGAPEEGVNFGCRPLMHRYRKLNKISEGTYGAVFRAVNNATGDIIALKQVKFIEALWHDGFPMAALREVSILSELNHPNIVNVAEVVIGKSRQHVFMVMEYVEHELKVLLTTRKLRFGLAEKKELFYQLLRALEYLHSHWIVHRDLKTSNLLYSNRGLLKVCDFGMARKFGEPARTYTKDVTTLWYRAPEVLLGLGHYGTAVDLWAAGCVFAELILERALFMPETETCALRAIMDLIGTPTPAACEELRKFPRMAAFGLNFVAGKPRWREVFPAAPKGEEDASRCLSDAGLDLLQRLLDLNPKTRYSATDALRHEYFSERPVRRTAEWMPTVPETNAIERRPRAPGVPDSMQSVDVRQRLEARGVVLPPAARRSRW